MLKNILIAVCTLLVVTAAVGYSMRESIVYALISSQLSPSHDFDSSLAPAQPDYKQKVSWAALPGSGSPAEDRPDSITSRTNPANVDVFFVHPTSYLSSESWNQPLNDETANWIVDQRILRHQVSVFNTCCEIYAPRYREQALQLAYQDVTDAFDEFLDRRDPSRPFILAGHSQGTRHAARLLRDRIANSPLVDKMVAAYLIGFSIGREQVGGIASCTKESQTGCVVAWNSVEGDGQGIFPEATDLICVNPLTWSEDNIYAAHDLNQGGIGYASYNRAEEGENFTDMTIEPGVADAQCIKGVLSVRELRTDTFPSRMQGGSMHIYDYSLFHMNIRENTSVRIDAYLNPTSI